MIPKTLLIFIILISCFNIEFNTVSAQQVRWKQMQGPFGGDFASIAIAKDGTIYCGSFNGYVYRSTDEGMNWTQLPALSNDLYPVNPIVVDTEGEVYVVLESAGLFKSTDKGNTWISLGLNSSTLRCVAIDPMHYVYAGNDNGLYRSIDHGKSWEKYSKGIAGGASLIVIDTVNTDIYASIGGRLYRANDYSNNWNDCGLWSNSFVISKNGVLFNARNWDGCYYSKDKGVTWTKIYGIPSNEGRFRFYLADNGNLILTATYNHLVFISTNNGDIWIETTFSKYHYWDITQHPNGDLYIATSTAGVLKSNDFGSTWTRTNLSAINVNSIKITSQSEIFVNNDFYEIQNSTDQGKTWSILTNNLPAVVSFCIDRNYNGQLFIGSPEGIFRSEDNGITWDKVLDTLAYFRSIATYYSVYSRKNIIYAGSELMGVLKSLDEGNHWTIISPVLGVRQIAIYDENEIYIAADKNIYRSLDAGKTWKNINIPNQTFYCYVLKVDHYGNIYAGGDNVGIYVSSDQGNKWIEIGFPAVTVKDIVITESGEIYVTAYYNRVYRTKDKGKHWEKVTEGLPNCVLTSLALDDQGYIYVGTYRYGVYKTENSITVINESSQSIPQAVSLSQNYPNPFTTSTTISFNLTSPRRVFDPTLSLSKEREAVGQHYITLKVFDLLGREVLDLSELARSNSSPEGGLVIHNSQLPKAGVYIYRLQVGNEMISRKMMLIE